MKNTITENSIMWAVVTIFSATLFALSAISVASCDSDDSDRSGTSDIQHCRDTVGVIDECFDGGVDEMMGMSKSDALEECETRTFDSEDRCFFDCEDDAMDCSEFADCIDGC